MSEIVIYTDHGEYFDKARKCLDANKEDLERLDVFAANYGIGKEDFAFNCNRFYVKITPDTEKFRLQACKNTKIWQDVEWFIIKGNSGLGKSFSVLYETLNSVDRPDPCFTLFSGDEFLGRYSYSQFFYNGRLYIHAKNTSGKEVAVPEGFTGMKLSEYYRLVEELQEKNWEGIEKV